jgi:hypothetical protein
MSNNYQKDGKFVNFEMKNQSLFGLILMQVT